HVACKENLRIIKDVGDVARCMRRDKENAARLIADFDRVAFVDAEGKSVSLKDWHGKTVLLNVWAPWCGPCRQEMPALDRLEKELGSDKFQVVALSVDKDGIEAAKKFLANNKVENLKPFADPTARDGATLKVFGMPTTILIDPEGREIGRLVGPAEWDSEDAKRLISAQL
ncbi:MAG TPA: TlpA family protein disulfide reductase, partial [Planctomycetes bacterium]|nr:TlpA family protein disulfide reductase [Planctomycetota bacterium]